MWIGEADDLTGVAGIGKDLLITGETGIENDFAAAARDGSGCAAVKDAAVFEGEDGRAMRNFGQRVLLMDLLKVECIAKRREAVTSQS